MELSDVLREEMERRGWSAYEFSRQSTVNESLLGKILNGVTKKPYRETLSLLSSALGGKLVRGQYGNWTFEADTRTPGAEQSTNGMRVVYRKPVGVEEGVPYFSDAFLGGTRRHP